MRQSPNGLYHPGILDGSIPREQRDPVRLCGRGYDSVERITVRQFEGDGEPRDFGLDGNNAEDFRRG